MTKTYQRIILLVAVIICGLAYGLTRWQAEKKPETLDPTSRAMRLFITDSEARAALQKNEKFWLLSLERTAHDPIAATQHQVMGGLGSAVLAVQLVLHAHTGRTEWQQVEHPEYPNILQLYPPEAEIPAILRYLRVCDNPCQNQSRFLYLIDPKDFAVRYYGDHNWNTLALVQDVRNIIQKQ